MTAFPGTILSHYVGKVTGCRGTCNVRSMEIASVLTEGIGSGSLVCFRGRALAGSLCA